MTDTPQSPSSSKKPALGTDAADAVDASSAQEDSSTDERAPDPIETGAPDDSSNADDVTLDAISTPPVAAPLSPTNEDEPAPETSSGVEVQSAIPAEVEIEGASVELSGEEAEVDSDSASLTPEAPSNSAADVVNPLGRSASSPARVEAESSFPQEHGVAEDEFPPTEANAPPAFFEDRSGDLPLAGSRAERRVREGWRLTTSVGVGITALAALPSLAILAGFLAYPVATPPPPQSPPNVTLAPATAVLLKAKEAQAAALERERELLTESLTLRAQNSARAAGRAIAVARDARRKDGKKGSALSAAFSAKELSALPKALPMTEDAGRKVFSRDGKTLFGAIEVPQGLLSVPSSSGADVQTEQVANRLFVRACVVSEKVCVVESAPLSLAPLSLDAGAKAITEAEATWTAFKAASIAAPQSNSVDGEQRRLATIVLALLVALAGAALLIRFLTQRVSRPLAAARHRAQLLAQGRLDAAPTADGVREVEDVDAALDAIADGMVEARQQLKEADARRDRLVAMADVLDAIARGAVEQRVDVTGSVAEQALATATNRLADALQRHSTRLESHLDVLDRAKGGDGNESSALQRRVAALKPMSPLISDIGQRLTALSAQPGVDETVKRDLARLGEAISQRAKTATALFTALEREAQHSAGSADSTTLNQLRDDLRTFAAAPALPTLLLSLASGPAPLDAADIAHRAQTAAHRENAAS